MTVQWVGLKAFAIDVAVALGLCVIAGVLFIGVGLWWITRHNVDFDDHTVD